LSDASIHNFSLYSSTDATFAELTLLGSYTGTSGSGDETAIPLQQFPFDEIFSQFIQLSIDGVWGIGYFFPHEVLSPNINVGEFAFAGTQGYAGVAVAPIPAALPLFGTGLAILGFMGWRRRRKAAAAA